MLRGKKEKKKETRDRQVKSIKSPREGGRMEKETTRDFEVQVLDGTAGTRDEGRHDRQSGRY